MKTIKCILCDNKLEKTAIGLNKKLRGEKVNSYYCLPCFAEHIDVPIDDLLSKIEDFKAQGCELF